MDPNTKCLCLFGNPIIGMRNNCQIHGIKHLTDPVQKIRAEIEARIKCLNEADTAFCKDRWDMEKPYFVRALAREESNKVTFARQELELLLKSI